MGFSFVTMLESIVLVIALSIDAFVASFAYGTNKIKIPVLSTVIITVVCSAVLAVSLCVGTAFKSWIPEDVTKGICFSILFLLGIVKLFDSTIKAFIRRHKNMRKKVNFSMFHLKFILSVYADPEDADSDSSRSLSPGEAVSLAMALSLDGLAVGFGAALVNMNAAEAIAFSLIFGFLAVVTGSVIGNRVAAKTKLDLSWVGGAMLMVLAFMKL